MKGNLLLLILSFYYIYAFKFKKQLNGQNIDTAITFSKNGNNSTSEKSRSFKTISPDDIDSLFPFPTNRNLLTIDKNILDESVDVDEENRYEDVFPVPDSENFSSATERYDENFELTDKSRDPMITNSDHESDVYDYDELIILKDSSTDSSVDNEYFDLDKKLTKVSNF